MLLPGASMQCVEEVAAVPDFLNCYDLFSPGGQSSNLAELQTVQKRRPNARPVLHACILPSIR